jgi:hypothetical protein
MTAPDTPEISSGAQRDASPSAFRLMPLRGATPSLPQAPERKPRDLASPAGYATIIVSSAGIYQVTLDSAAWIDLIQRGAYLKPTAFSGALDCTGVRKLVRFGVEGGPLTLQITDASTDRIGLIVAPSPSN